jgi:hypothetical protein
VEDGSATHAGGEIGWEVRSPPTMPHVRPLPPMGHPCRPQALSGACWALVVLGWA